MSSSTTSMLNIAIKTARAAGAIINRASLDIGSVRVHEKKAHDFVTETDHASEKLIVETLLEAFPAHGILTEETAHIQGNEKSDYQWIVDPLDGTHNFMHGFPIYCVSIALNLRGKTELGVIFDPTRNDLFTATRGRGAYLNDRRLRVSKQTDLTRSSIATGFPAYRDREHERLYLTLNEIMRRAHNLRRTGSAALDLAYVAAGYTDGFFELGLNAWDVAAGALLVIEAGGLVGNFVGESNFLHEKELIAAPVKVYAQLVTILNKYSQFADAESKEKLRAQLEAFAQFNQGYLS